MTGGGAVAVARCGEKRRVGGRDRDLRSHASRAHADIGAPPWAWKAPTGSSDAIFRLPDLRAILRWPGRQRRRLRAV